MGRPINKKYFGNKNKGSLSTTADNGIGGEGVVSVVVTEGGNFSNTGGISTPTIVFPTPDLPTGVTAIAEFVLVAESATPSGTPSASYTPGEALIVEGGTNSAPATFTVSSVKVGALTTDNTGNNFAIGDTLTFSTGWVTPAVLTVANVSAGGHITSISVTNAGVWNNSSLPSNPVAFDTTSGSGPGTSATFNFKFMPNQVALAAAGQYTLLPTNPASIIAPQGSAAGCTLNVVYTIDGVIVLEPGSGYVDIPTPTVSNVTNNTGSAVTLAPVVLTNTQDNAFSISAWVDVPGATAKQGDIIKQESANRFKCRTADGVGVLKLTAADTVYAGEVRLSVEDSDGGTYYLSKITARTCTVVRATGTQFADHQRVRWNIVEAVENVSVKLLTV